MLTVPRDIPLSDFNKLNLRTSRSPVIAQFTLQGFAFRNAGLIELLVPNNEVLLLPRGAAANIALRGVKYDFRDDNGAGRYNSSFTVRSRADGQLSLFALNSDTTGLTTTFSSSPGVVEIGIDAMSLPNVPGQQYLRFQTRGVSSVDIQFVLYLNIVTTQPLLG